MVAANVHRFKEDAARRVRGVIALKHARSAYRCSAERRISWR